MTSATRRAAKNKWAPKEKRIGDDILDPHVRRPMILSDNKTIRFPAHWPKRDGDEWRKHFLSE